MAQVGAVCWVATSDFAVLLRRSTSSLLPDTKLEAALQKLVDGELLYVCGLAPEATYSFKHALIQETAYQSLLKRTRQQLHARIAQVLEERFPERVAAEPEVIARHYDQAGLTVQAIAHYQRSGERATQRSANREAIGHLRRALNLVATLPGNASVIRWGARAAGGARGAARRSERMVAPGVHADLHTGARTDVPDRSCRASCFASSSGMAAAYFVKGDLTTATEVAQEALAAAEHTGQAFDLLSAHYVAG